MADVKISALPSVSQASLTPNSDVIPIVHSGITSQTTLAAAVIAAYQATGIGSGTVTAVSVASANGFAGSVATPNTTPTITLTTTLTGLLKGNGTAMSAAVAGTDYVTPTGTESLSNKTIASPTFSGTATGTYTLSGTPTIVNYVEGVVAIGNSSTAQTIALTNGTVQTVTLTGNCTFTMPTAVAGKSFVLIINTGAGSFTGTFTGVKWPAATAPTITTTASKVDIISFISDGTSWYGNAAQAFA